MRKIYALLFTLTISSLSFGQVILNEGLNYADNTLLTTNGWSVTSAGGTNAIDVGASNGLTYAGYSGVTGLTGLVEGNAAKIDNIGEDVNKAFASNVTSGTLYYSFLVNVAADGAGGYFTHLGTGTSAFAARVFVKPGAGSGKINFGLSNSGTASYAASPTEFDLNTTYLIIVKYDVSGTGAASMWVKSTGVPATELAAGAPEHTTTGTGQATISGVYLRQYSATQNITLDAILVASTWFGSTPCNLTLGTATTLCDAITLNMDTYTATIPFTGGNTGTYNLSANVGTIGGDNPSSTATGNITISNIPEGTGVTLTVSGTCDLNKVVTAPECKPVNTLPYAENFNYTAGNVLGNEQRWSIANSGDNILVAAGNLNYTGLISSGNSVTFDGGGAEAHTPFTATTSGTLYASFLMNVTSNTAMTEGGEGYFAVLTNGVFNGFEARIFIKKTGTTYQLGLTSAATTTNYTSGFFNVGDVVYVVMGYDFTTNTLKAWFNPTVATFTAATTPDLTETPAAPITTLGGFLLRQDGTNTTPFTTIDELRIATTVSDLLSVKENNISGLNVYPNPANDFLHITTTANAMKTVAIYDLVGKQVLNTTTSNEVINVSSLNAGIYLVKITEEGKTATRKLVIR